MKKIIFFLLYVCVLSGYLVADEPEKRIALVIGNGEYESSPLQNPTNDAKDVSSVLQDVNFEVTTLVNASALDMDRAISDFGKKLLQNPDAVGLFYFAGHGMQVEGRNYLIPVKSNINAEDEVKFKAIDAGMVLSKMESAGNATNIVILDACRDNPFARSFRSSSRGLSVVDAPQGSLVVYATAPGSTAADGDGRNGIFTKAFLSHISEPGLDIEIMLREVRNQVREETGGKQIPWSSSSLMTSFYFVEEKEPEVAQAPQPKPEPLPSEENRSAGRGPVKTAGPERIPAILNLGVPGLSHILEKKPVGWVYLASAALGIGAFTFSEIYFQIQRDAIAAATTAEEVTAGYNTQKVLLGVSISSIAIWALSAIISTIHSAAQ